MTDVNSIEVPQVNSLPPAPLRSEAGNTFAIKAEAFVAALPPFRIGMIALGSVTRQLALIAQAEALAAAQSATQASQSKDAAAQSATQAAQSKDAAAQSATQAAQSKDAAAQSATQAALSVSNMPIIRLTKNQALTGSSGAPPLGWYAHPDCTFENVCNIGSDLNPENRHSIAKELLDYIGIRAVAYFGRGFNIWRLTWPSGTPYLMYQFLNLSNPLSTVAAYTKLEYGQVTGAWANGATNTWKLTGQQAVGGMMHQYWALHPIPISSAGSLLFALPAAVIGKTDLNNHQQWALYPYIGDQQYD